MSSPNGTFTVPHCTMEYLISSMAIPLVFVTLSIPLYELLIYPFVRNWIPRTTVRIGLGIIVALFGMLALLAIDATGHSSSVTPTSTVCMFYENKEGTGKISIHPVYLIPVILILTFGKMLFFIATFEFIVAQSPYGMRGLILGLWFMIYGITVGFLSMVLVAFSIGFKYVTFKQPSCGTSYITAVLALGCVSTLLYFIAVWRYKMRQRGGQVDVNHQTILEGYYESGRINSNSFVSPQIRMAI